MNITHRDKSEILTTISIRYCTENTTVDNLLARALHLHFRRRAFETRIARQPKYVSYAPLERFAFGKTSRGPRCPRQARQRLANYDLRGLTHNAIWGNLERVEPLTDDIEEVELEKEEI